MYTFSTPSPANISVELRRGAVRIVASDAPTTQVDMAPLDGDSAAQALIDAAEVTQDGANIRIHVPRGQDGFFRERGKVLVTVRTPAGSHALVKAGSAKVATEGELGNLRIYSGSGRIDIDQGRDVEANTGSGDIKVGHARGDCDVRTGSGRIEIGAADGETRMTTGSGALSVGKAGAALKAISSSGDVSVRQTGPEVDLFAASGRVSVEQAGPGRLRARTASGQVRIGVTRGLPTWLDVRTMSGQVRSSLDASGPPSEGEDHLTLVVQTTSGGVTLDHATP